MILLDTHVLIWAVEESEHLGRAAREAIETAEELGYSAMTAWELAMLVTKQRLRLTMTPERLLTRSREEGGVIEVAITGAMAMDAGTMPRWIHKDPADRFLMATARSLRCPILTADEKMLAHAAKGFVKAIDARR